MPGGTQNQQSWLVQALSTVSAASILVALWMFFVTHSNAEDALALSKVNESAVQHFRDEEILHGAEHQTLNTRLESIDLKINYIYGMLSKDDPDAPTVAEIETAAELEGSQD